MKIVHLKEFAIENKLSNESLLFECSTWIRKWDRVETDYKQLVMFLNESFAQTIGIGESFSQNQITLDKVCELSVFVTKNHTVLA